MANRVYTDREACLRCFDENELVFDENEKYLTRMKSTQIHLPDELYGELLRNVSESQEVFFMYIKQRIIMYEPRVRYNPHNDVVGLDEKIYGLTLSPNLKSFLREASSVGYSCLNEQNMLQNLVEFDSEQTAYVILYDKIERTMGQFDIISLIHFEKHEADFEPPQSFNKSKRKLLKHGQGIQGSQESSPSYSSDPKPLHLPLKFSQSKHELRQENTSLTLNKQSDAVDRCEKAVISVILTPRNYLSATDFYRQLIFCYISNITRYFCIVLYIGPLVDRQELVLYEFNIPTKITDFIKSFSKELVYLEPIEQKDTIFEVSLTVNKTNAMNSSNQSNGMIQPNILDLNQLEMMFRQVLGSKLQAVADLKSYFRYYISDCIGVKNHLNDKKHRYERYTAKKAAKKENRLRRKLCNESQPKQSDYSGQSVIANASSN